MLPLQEEMPFAVASQISPSGMTLAGKHGIGVISIGSMSEEGLNALPTQWGFAETAAKKHGTTVDRKDWRVLLSWHIAETREKAIAEARQGLLRHHNEYIVGTLQRPGAKPFTNPDEAIEKTAYSDGAAATIGTPDDLVARIKSVLEISGGFGTVVGFVHDWANPENTLRSWDMVARYVVPEINGYLAGLRESQHSSRPTAASSTAPRKRSWPRSTRTRPRSPRSPSPAARGSATSPRPATPPTWTRRAATRKSAGRQRRSDPGREAVSEGRKEARARARFSHPAPRSSRDSSSVARISKPRNA